VIHQEGHPRPPGWSRRPARGGRPRFAYLDDSGRSLTDAEALARIAALALPPAWADVWISPDPGAKVQAVGVDAAGRTQYRYSTAWTALRAREKFAHVPDFARALPLLRTEVAHRLGARPDGGSDETPPLDRERVLAAAVRLLDLGFFRVGSERYARDNHTYGLTTLQRGHVRVDGDVVHFDYTAKEHRHRVVEVTDPAVADVVRRLLARDDPGPDLLAWQLPDGRWQRVHSAHVNSYVHALTGIDATAKQFRTWAGTVLAAAALGGAEHEERSRSALVAAIKATSRLLGNTPAVARASYVHPAVVEAFEQGRTAEAAVRAARERSGERRLSVLWRDPEVQDATLDLIATRPDGPDQDVPSAAGADATRDRPAAP
jgi:DNA topoisomerase-1